MSMISFHFIMPVIQLYYIVYILRVLDTIIDTIIDNWLSQILSISRITCHTKIMYTYMILFYKFWGALEIYLGNIDDPKGLSNFTIVVN